MKPNLTYLNFCRYICIIGAVILTMLSTSIDLYPILIIFSLIILINSQLRITLLKNNLFIASLIADIILLVFLQYITGGYAFLILISTLIDSIINAKGEIYPLFIIQISVLGYLVYSINSLELIIIISLFFSVVFLLLLNFRYELAIKQDTETLYEQLRKANLELEATKSRLLEYSKQVEKLSQVEERNRISRELHDSVGHSLTGILMQVDAAIQYIPINQERGLEILTEAYDNINKGIEVVRQTVRKLRPQTYQTYMASLKELTYKFQKDTGVKVNLTISGTPYELYPSIEITLYKNIREALTNAVRHGKAKNMHIDLNYSIDKVELSIQDDGIGAISVNKGFGLSGMEERLELVEGTLTYCSEPGFRITMTIPRKEIE